MDGVCEVSQLASIEGDPTIEQQFQLVPVLSSLSEPPPVLEVISVSIFLFSIITYSGYAQTDVPVL